MSLEIAKKRKAMNIYSQPANNKILGIYSSLNNKQNDIKIISSGLVNARSMKWYKGYIDNKNTLDLNIIYCGIIDLPFLNILSSIITMFFQILKENKKSKIDNIIFYNFKPEVAMAAYLAKIFLKIPITVEYEDGYEYVEGSNWFKYWIFKKTEIIVSKNIDSAILVNSLLKDKFNVPSVVVRGIVDKEFFLKCKKYKKEKNNIFTIVYTGGLDQSRGIQILLEAFSLIEFETKLIITGKGSLDFNDPRIDFRGFIPYEDVQSLIMQADVLVQCQLSGHDFSTVSFPSKLFEYIPSKNYIISSKISDVVSFAGNSILYYEDDDALQLSKQLEKVYNFWKNDKQNNDLEYLCLENLAYSIGIKIEEILL